MFEGHAFIVEAAISLGGNMRPGINIHRFANRIPLLFEGGSDVVTRTATKRISWSNYRINHNSDKVGVFVSIVSTKIPFKGAGKEYIGEHTDGQKHLRLTCTVTPSTSGSCTRAVEQLYQHARESISRHELTHAQTTCNLLVRSFVREQCHAAIFSHRLCD